MTVYKYEQVKENKNLPVRFDVAYETYHTVPLHWHKDLEILCMLKGEMTAIIRAEEYVVHAGDILIVNSEEIHMTKIFGKETSYILLQISDSRLKEFFPEFHRLKFASLIKNEQPQTMPCQLMNKMLEIYYGRKKGYSLLFTAKLYELLHCLYCEHSMWDTKETQIEYSRFSSIKQILNWIQSHYSESIDLSEAADQMGFSREHFCRVFKQYTGMTFLEYINELRVIKIYEDMLKSEESVSNLMKKHGVSNYKIFLRIFKKLYGDTPQNLKKQKMMEEEKK